MKNRKPPARTQPRIDGAQRAEIVDRLYQVAMDPIRLDDLLESWENHLVPAAGGLDGAGGHPGLVDGEIEAHLSRASVFLDRFEVTREDGGYRSILEEIPRLAAFVSDGGATILGWNRPAAQALGLTDGARLADLPFEPEDIEILRAAILRVASGREEKVISLRIHSPLRESPVILRVGPLTSGGPQPLALIVSTELTWPDGFEATVQEAFGLTAAEAEIVRGIALGLPVKAIAEARGRSAETVRTQLRSILAKTETHSQSELVRVVLALMDLAVLPVAETVAPAPTAGRLEPRVFQAMRLPSGRHLTWIEFGARFGKACLVMHTDYGLVRWPAEAEREAERLGMRVIVPLRAGYGGTSAYAAGDDALAAATEDYLAVIDRLGLGRVAVLAMGSALRFAASLALARPEAVTGILGVACQLPLQSQAQFERMDKWQRFTVASARHSPKILPFVIKAGFSMARQIGKEAYFAQVNGGSPADIATFARPEVREALLAGSEVLMREGATAHEAFTRECIGSARDWSPLLHKLQLPVRLLQGDQDPMTPAQTLRELLPEFPGIRASILPGTGQLLFFAEWPVVLRELMEIFAS